MSPEQLSAFSLAYVVVAAVAGLCAVLQVLRLRWSDDRTFTGILFGSFALKASAFVLSIPWIYRTIDRTVAVPNLSRLVVDLVHGVGWSTAVLILLGRLGVAGTGHRPTSTRTRLAVATGVAGVMALLWVISPTPERPVPQYAQFDGNGAHAPYMVFYLAVVATGLVMVTRTAWRFAALDGPWWLRAGLRVAALGAAAHLAVCGMRVMVMCGVPMVGVSSDTRALGAPLMLAVGNLLMVVGLSLPVTATMVTTVRHHLRARREYLVMRPLWSRLYAVRPEIALAHPGYEVGSLPYRLYRRKVEIRDGLIYVQTHVATADTDTGLRELTRLGDIDPLASARRYLVLCARAGIGRCVGPLRTALGTTPTS